MDETLSNLLKQLICGNLNVIVPILDRSKELGISTFKLHGALGDLFENMPTEGYIINRRETVTLPHDTTAMWDYTHRNPWARFVQRIVVAYWDQLAPLSTWTEIVERSISLYAREKCGIRFLKEIEDR